MALDLQVAPGATVEQFQREFLENLRYGRGVDLAFATPNDRYQALATTVRAYLIQSWLDTLRRQLSSGARFVYYFSAEYLLGRQLDNNLLSADLQQIAQEALAGLGLDLQELRDCEVEPGLGNGGLGRLGACFIDSLATLQIPAVAYGIRYQFGIFQQTFVDGWQVERADDWLALGNPWEFPHPEMDVEVGFGGSSMPYTDEQGRMRWRWQPARIVLGVPYNIMVPGFRSGTVNTLRLWNARATQAFDLAIFNAGDYRDAVAEKTSSETISKVLYPDDTTAQGKQLRLEQQYFFVACSLRDILGGLPEGFDLRRLPERAVIQLNDTHPTVAIPELMRLLLDEHAFSWDEAWAITTAVFAYTCHTLLPEALEQWPVSLFERLLPRHLEIIYEINARFLAELRGRYPGDEERVRRMSLVAEGGERQIRMAHLATVGSFRVNGVAELHSQLLRDKVLYDFADLWPEKFTNVTNGVTPRRFVRLANPRLADLISETIGEGWLRDLERLRELEPYADDPAFQERWREVKQANKQRLAGMINARTGVRVETGALFDIMVKRLHEYKRQLLKLLHAVVLYNRILADPARDATPRLIYFGAKAAPGYWMAKRIIKLINDVAAVVNSDPAVGNRLKIVFPPNYNVSAAEWIIPAADLSEQISMAGKEASGTGNMKFALNGALTVGTLDGANVEIRELVGAENFFLFGLTEAEVAATKAAGYRPRDDYEANPELRQVIEQIAAGRFSNGDHERFAPIVASLLERDEFLVCADFASYVAAQDQLEQVYNDQPRWTRMAILNCARCGFFSSDRSMRDYLERIWRAVPVPAA